MTSSEMNEIIGYIPPVWCRGLKVIPTCRIPLTVLPTPIHRWKIEDVPSEFQLFVKRDDLTGSTLSGNKVRKLEFILADAKAQGHDAVITFGSTQSNHARATAIAARQLGLDCYLLLCDKHQNCKTSTPSGNFFLMEAAGSNIYIIPWHELDLTIAEEKMKILRDHIRDEIGKSSYIIPPGGDSSIGVHGYLNAWEEMLQQNIIERFDDVVVCCGSSGTLCGLAIGNYLTGSKLRIHGVLNNGTKEWGYEQMNKILDEYGIEDVQAKDIVDLIDDYVGDGYDVFGKEDVDHYLKIFRSTGIYCDPVYVGIAIRALVTEMNKNPGRFQGKRILFIHTGGIFGMMTSEVGNMLHDESAISRIKDWEEVFPDNQVKLERNHVSK